jgi:GAF domain-containing protein
MDSQYPHPDDWGGAAVPIRTALEIVGVLSVGVQAPREFTSHEVNLLTTIAEIAGNAIHRMRLHEQTEQRLLRLTALRAMDVAISSSLDVRVTLNVLLDQVAASLGVDAAAVLTLNPITQVLEYALGRGFNNPNMHQTRLRLGQGFAGISAIERRTLVTSGNEVTDPSQPRAAWFAAEGFVAHSVTPLIAKGEVKGVLEVFQRAPLSPDPEWIEFFEALAGQAAMAVESAQQLDSLQRANTELAVAYDASIEAWARALDLRNHEGAGHSRRMADLALVLARLVHVPDTEQIHLRRGALLHDLGKTALPDSILLKPGPLTEAEWELVRQHPQLAFDMLVHVAYLRPCLDILLSHHERWDGAGYPRGLKGLDIPLAARIVAVVDAWDALVSDRPHRPAWPEAEARAHLAQQSGKQFDPEVVSALLRLTAPP